MLNRLKFAHMLLWKFEALCNKGVWGVPICYGALQIGIWGLKTAILGVTLLLNGLFLRLDNF